MADLQDFDGEVASEVDDRIDLFAATLEALVETNGGFVLFGCEEAEDALVQFAWSPPRVTCEVGGIDPEQEETKAKLRTRGFRAPGAERPNWSLEIKGPHVGTLGVIVEEIFFDVFGCEDDYTARVDSVETF